MSGRRDSWVLVEIRRRDTTRDAGEIKKQKKGARSQRGSDSFDGCLEMDRPRTFRCREVRCPVVAHL